MLQNQAMTRGTKWLTTFALNASFLMTGVGSSILGSTLPSLALNLGVGVNALTIVVMSKGAGYVIGSLLTPFFARRISQYGILMFSLFCITVGQTACPLMTSIISLSAVEVISGMGMGVMEISGYVLIFNLWKNASDSIMQSTQLCYAIGSSLAPFIAFPFIYETLSDSCQDFSDMSANTTSDCVYNVSKKMLIDHVPYLSSAYFIVGGCATMISMIFCYLALTQAKILAPRNAEQQVHDNTIFRFLWLIFQAMFYFGHVGVEISVSSFLYTFLTISDFKASKTVGTTLNSIWWISFMLGNLVAMIASKKFSPRQILTIDAFGVLISMMFLLLSGLVSDVFIWLAIPMYGFFLASMYPSGLSWSERCILLNARATSVFVVSGSMGDIIIQCLIGQQIKDNPKTLLWVVSAVTLGTVLAFSLLYLLEKKKSKFPEKKSSVEIKKHDSSIESANNRQDEDKSTDETSTPKEEEKLLEKCEAVA